MDEDKLIARGGPGYGLSLLIGLLTALLPLSFLTVGWVIDLASGEDVSTNHLGALVIGLALPGVIITLILWLVTAITAMSQRRAIKQLFVEQWARWRYSPHEWQSEVERLRTAELAILDTRRKHIDGRIMRVMAVFIVLGLVLHMSVSDLVGAVVVVGLIYGGTIIVAPLLGRRAARAYYTKRLATLVPEIVLSANGFYHEVDGYTSLKPLVDVQYLRGSPPMIAFTILKTVGKGRKVRADVSVRVPYGRENEGEALATRYRIERVRL